MQFRHFTRCFVLGVSLAACEGGDPPPEPGLDPVEKCDEFLTVVCSRAVMCAGASKDEAVAARRNCDQSWRARADCADFPASDTAHDSCVGELRAFSCEVLLDGDELDLPASCDKILSKWL